MGQKLHKVKREHKRHWGLLLFAVMLILVLLVLKGEHLTWAVITARLLETVTDLAVEKGLGGGDIPL